MNTHFIFNRFNALGKIRVYVLALLWGIGILLGILMALYCDQTFKASILQSLSNGKAPYLILLTAGFPIMVAVVVIYTEVFAVAYPLILLESVSHGFCGMMLFCEFGSGAWLMRLVLMFSTSCASVLMWWLLFRHSTCKKPNILRDILFALILIFCISLFDIFVISPFLNGLSMYI